MSTGAIASEQQFALGLGLTNECNLACSFCYRDPARLDRISLEQVQRIVGALPVRSVNLGTGENGMHPDFHNIIRWLKDQPLRMTMTSNGHSVELLSDEELSFFSDIEFSLDYDNRAQQDGQRGAGNWELVHRQAARCRTAGVPVTIISVMMKSNYKNLANVARVARRYDAPLRINVYQSVRTDIYALTYNEYWEGFRLLLDRTDLISTRGTSDPRDGRPAGSQRWLRLRHSPGYAPRHGTTLRVLAGRRRPTQPITGAGLGDCRHRTVSGCALATRGVHQLRICGRMPWGLRR